MPISSVLGSSALLPAGLGFRNLIINGDMRINQRNTSIANSGYSVDRWALQKFGSGTAISVAQSSDAPPNFTNSLKMTTTYGAAETSAWFYQRVEGYNAASLGFGTASAKQVTVSFWVKSSLSGTYSVTLQNNNATRVYAASYTISASNTWEKKTITIPGDTTGSWSNTTDTGLSVLFPFGTNGFPSSAYVTSTLDAWFTGAGGMAFNVGTSATPNIMATTGNIFAVTGVQLEQNYQPTPFEQRPVGVELVLCQRYFRIISTGYLSAYNPYWNVGLSGGDQRLMYPFGIQMRSTPSVVTSAGSVLHSFAYRSYNTGVNNYTLEAVTGNQDVAGIGGMGYYSTNNGGSNLPISYTVGTNNNPVWVSAEL